MLASQGSRSAFPPFVGTGTFLPLIQIAPSHCPRWIRGLTLATGSRCIGLTFINNNTESAIAFVRPAATISNALSEVARRDFPAIDVGALRGIRKHILAADISGEPSLITTTARAPIAVSSLCRLDSLAADSNRPAYSPRKSDVHILEHRIAIWRREPC